MCVPVEDVSRSFRFILKCAKSRTQDHMQKYNVTKAAGGLFFSLLCCVSQKMIIRDVGKCVFVSVKNVEEENMEKK